MLLHMRHKDLLIRTVCYQVASDTQKYRKVAYTTKYTSFAMCDQYYCLSNALHSSIGQNIKSHPCPLSGVRSPVSVLRPECEKLQNFKSSNGHNSVTRHPIDFVFGSNLGFLARIALLNLTAHELHELYYDRPTSHRA